MSRWLTAFVFSLAWLLPCAVHAAPGDLDTSFGGGAGWVSTPLARPDADQAYSVIQQADGKLVVAGSSASGAATGDFALARYNSNGSLDATFNGTGKLTTAIGVGNDVARSLIQQADGKLVVAGWSSNDGNNNDFALARYNSDGSLDTTFNGTGKLATAIGASNDYAQSLIQQIDGKLVAAGHSLNGSDYDFALVRYNSDGSLDTTFNGTGKLTTAFGVSTDRINSVIQQTDGKLVVAGSSSNGSDSDFALVRYNSDGSLDTTFNGTGKLITAIGVSNDSANSVIQQADGKLVVAGNSSNGSNDDFALVRYNSDGALDTTFNGTGKLITAVGVGNDVAQSLIQQIDGKLAAAGYSHNGSNHDFALVRYNNDGSLDVTFNGTGKLTTAIGASDDYAQSLIQQTNGKLVAAGYGHNGSNNNDFALVRYNSNGSLDTTFDTDGKLLTNVALTSKASASSVVRQTDGKLAAVGYSYNGSNDDFALVRYNSDGSSDTTTFNGIGKLTTAIGASNDYAQSLIQQIDGKLVAVGSSSNGSNNDIALVRYNSDGFLDTTFKGTGKLTSAIGASDDVAYSIIQQADGKLVVAGGSHNGSNWDFALVRYNSDGSLDTTFNGTGKLITAVGVGNDVARSLIQQADGKLVAAGYSYNGSNDDFALVRYNSDGSLDATFNGTGKLITAIGVSNDSANSVIQQADGKLVVAGNSSNGSNNDVALVRYNNDGSLDATFNGEGKLTTAIGTGNDDARSVIQQSDGKLVAAGSSSNGSNNDVVLVRYNSDGSLDATLNGTGKLITTFSVWDDSASSVIQQPDGKLVVAGSITMPTLSIEFIVARFESGQSDTDVDGYVDGLDNCNNIMNSDQLNIDADSYGDACDPDIDGDGVANAQDTFPLDATASQDSDSDGFPDQVFLAGDDFETGDLTRLPWSSTGDALWSVVSDNKHAGNFSARSGGIEFGQQSSLSVIINTGSELSFYIAVSEQNCGFFWIDFYVDGNFVNDWYACTGAIGWQKFTQALTPGLHTFTWKHTSYDSVGSAVWIDDVNYGSSLVMDNCPLVENPDQINTDGDANGDACDTTPNGDADNDGVDNLSDNCVTVSNANQLNTDGDAQGNVCDTDDDNDGVSDGSDVFPLDASESVDTDSDTVGDNIDNCVAVANTNQLDTDADGAGDVCDNTPNGDTDNDDIDNLTDNCVSISNADQLNSDGDTQGNVCDNDDDNDGVADGSDVFPLDASESGDADSDTVGDNTDNCVAVANTNQLDTDTDGAGDACDNTPNGDTDNDGVDDLADNCPLIANSNQLDWDSDGNGDRCDDPVPVPADIAGLLGKDKAGSAVAFAGDVNGDGYGDYIVGMPGYDLPAAPPVKIIKGAGRAEVISGKDGTVLFFVNGVAAKDAMGAAVAGNADINNDGFADVLVGAPFADGVAEGNANDVGSVTVLFGPNGATTQTLYGEQKKAAFGTALALGDLDSDGYAEILVGAPKMDAENSLTDAGAVMIFDHSNTLIQTHTGVAAKDYSGSSVGVGDINNDGSADVIVGSPNADDVVNRRVDAGKVMVFSSSTDNALLAVYGMYAKGLFGTAVAAGDVNSDGVADVVIGAPADENGSVKNAGSVTALSGSDGARLTRRLGASANANYGNSVAVGDVNGDSFADIVAGTWRADTVQSPVINNAGSVFVRSGNNYSMLGMFYGDAANDYFGTAVSVGDINSDGKADVIIGIPGLDALPMLPATKLMEDAGGVRVLSGAGL